MRARMVAGTLVSTLAFGELMFDPDVAVNFWSYAQVVHIPHIACVARMHALHVCICASQVGHMLACTHVCTQINIVDDIPQQAHLQQYVPGSAIATVCDTSGLGHIFSIFGLERRILFP